MCVSWGNNIPGIEFSKFRDPETSALTVLEEQKEASVTRDESEQWGEWSMGELRVDRDPGHVGLSLVKSEATGEF